MGRYAHRQPFAYPPIREAVADRIAVVAAPRDADVILLAHWKDAVAEAAALDRKLGQGQRVVLLSEEPFWDTMWCPRPFHRDQTLPGAERPLTVLNHFTSALFDFAQIPYFLLTDPAYGARYRTRFTRLASQPAADWRARWEAAPYDIAFAVERREHPAHDRFWPAQGAQGLAAHRTRIALACDSPRVLRLGKGWDTETPRQTREDWHGDKLARLDGRASVIFAMENTWWPSYVTEKAFDALACGALPAGLGGTSGTQDQTRHRLHELFPPGPLLDLAGLTPAQAAARLGSARPDPEALRARAADFSQAFHPRSLAAECAHLSTRLVEALTA